MGARWRFWERVRWYISWARCWASFAGSSLGPLRLYVSIGEDGWRRGKGGNVPSRSHLGRSDSVVRFLCGSL